jgi:hypothetical protein
MCDSLEQKNNERLFTMAWETMGQNVSNARLFTLAWGTNGQNDS